MKYQENSFFQPRMRHFQKLHMLSKPRSLFIWVLQSVNIIWFILSRLSANRIKTVDPIEKPPSNLKAELGQSKAQIHGGEMIKQLRVLDTSGLNHSTFRPPPNHGLLYHAVAYKSFLPSFPFCSLSIDCRSCNK